MGVNLPIFPPTDLAPPSLCLTSPRRFYVQPASARGRTRHPAVIPFAALLARTACHRCRHFRPHEKQSALSVIFRQPTRTPSREAGPIIPGKPSASVAVIAALLIAGDHAVFDVDDTMRVFGDIVFVRDQDDRVALGLQTVEQCHDLEAGL